MGQARSSLVDCACDGDIQSLKTTLDQRRQQLAHAKNATSANNSAESEDEWLAEVEEAIHAVVSMEVGSAQQFQQLQIALELLLQANPTAWGSIVGNAVGWTGAHRACVTGNLSFLSFVFQRYDAHDVQTRDAFGLFPVDLVPPELLRSPADMAIDAALEPRVGGAEPIFPATARARRNLALQILRQKKSEAQARCIDQFLFHEHASQASTVSKAPLTATSATSDTEALGIDNQSKGCDDNQSAEGDARAASVRNAAADLAATETYFVAFEPCRDHIVADATTGSAGEVHERSTPLRLRYRFPRIDEFVHGYFQLIWRESEPRSEKPHYGAHVLMRDEVFLDPQGVDVACAQTRAAGETSTLARRLDDENPVLQGCFPFDVSQLPHDAVCHVLFVASDRHLMKRTVVLSTEAIALRDANDGYDFLDPRNNGAVHDGDDPRDADSDEESAEGDEREHEFVFHVAGEAFSHLNPAFADRSFEGLEDFEHFVKALRAASTGSRTEDARGHCVRATDGEPESDAATTVKQSSNGMNESHSDDGADDDATLADEQRVPETADSHADINQNEHKDDKDDIGDDKEEDNNTENDNKEQRQQPPEQAVVDETKRA